MIKFATSRTYFCDKFYAACRFLTVDADIEHNAKVLDFYKKNGFLVNEELFNKNRKTVSMRKDIYWPIGIVPLYYSVNSGSGKENLPVTLDTSP